MRTPAELEANVRLRVRETTPADLALTSNDRNQLGVRVQGEGGVVRFVLVVREHAGRPERTLAVAVADRRTGEVVVDWGAPAGEVRGSVSAAKASEWLASPALDSRTVGWSQLQREARRRLDSADWIGGDLEGAVAVARTWIYPPRAPWRARVVFRCPRGHVVREAVWDEAADFDRFMAAPVDSLPGEPSVMVREIDVQPEQIDEVMQSAAGMTAPHLPPNAGVTIDSTEYGAEWTRHDGLVRVAWSGEDHPRVVEVKDFMRRMWLGSVRAASE